MKLLLLMMFALMFTGCVNVIDRPVNGENFLDDIQVIRREYSNQYSKSDFDDLCLNAALTPIAAQSDKRTYHELLDSIKIARLRDDNENSKAKAAYFLSMQKYNDTVALLNKAINLKVFEKSIKAADAWGDFKNLCFKYTLTNDSKNTINAFKGSLTVKDTDGSEIASFDIDYDKPLTPGITITENSLFDASDIPARAAKIAQTDIHKLTFYWQPTEVIFIDGRHIKTPEEPEKPEDI
jgi:hypothetical protein